MEEIINKVANSVLKTIDLEAFYPEGKRLVFDLKDWLYEGLILREKDFREALKNHNWAQYQDAFIAIQCTAEAIVPAWAYMLVATQLQPYAKKTVQGTFTDLENVLYQEIIEKTDWTEYTAQKIIIKGCSNKPVPENAYLHLIQKLQPIADSIMYGEACSTVPLWKKKS